MKKAVKTAPTRPMRPMQVQMQYLTLALSILAILMMAAFFMLAPPPQAPPAPCPTPEPLPSPTVCAPQTPEHGVCDAKAYLSRVMATYREMMRSEVPYPEYDPCTKTWNAIVRIPSTGGERRVFVRINDTPALMLDNAYLEIVRPPFITEDRVLTNGTLLLAGKINCSNGSLVRMMEFSDPYCPSCILGDEKVGAFTQKFNSSVDFEYHILPSTMQQMEERFGREDVNRFAYYLVCTQKQHLLSAFMPCAIQKYRQKGVEAPLTKEELDACLPGSALDLPQFESCLHSAYAEVAFDKSLAQTYGVTETPVVLFDCKYRVLPEFLETGFCYTHPNATGCG